VVFALESGLGLELVDVAGLENEARMLEAAGGGRRLPAAPGCLPLPGRPGWRFFPCCVPGRVFCGRGPGAWMSCSLVRWPGSLCWLGSWCPVFSVLWPGLPTGVSGLLWLLGL